MALKKGQISSKNFLKKIVKPAVDSSDSLEVYFPTDLSLGSVSCEGAL